MARNPRTRRAERRARYERQKALRLAGELVGELAAADYEAGGLYWAEVQNVMNACACSRLRAVSALKVCRASPAQASAPNSRAVVRK